MNSSRPSRLPSKESSRGGIFIDLRALFGDTPRGAYSFFGRPVDIRKLRLCLVAVGAAGLILGAVLTAALWRGGSGDAGQGGLPGGIPATDTADSTDTEALATLDTETDTREAEVTETDTRADTPETQPAETKEDASDPAETEEETEPPLETDSVPGVPAGCYGIFSADMSRSDLGVEHLVGETQGLPAIDRGGTLWGKGEAPAVLIVHTHPYEGYSDGGAWYDPAEGALAQTESANASDGVVALGAALARALRELGVNVMQVRIAVSPEDSAADIYQRTESVVRTHCRLYPDIGLVLNLRRSAELTENGGILRTEGRLNGEPVAQARISVSGGRDEGAVERDLAVALALREGLWEIEPTLSRPVRIKAGAGLAGEFSDIRVLTLELGAAGNTYAEAARAIAPAAAVLSGMILDKK